MKMYLMRWDLINWFAEQLNATRYLEIGVVGTQVGKCMAAVRVPYKVGVDPHRQPGVERLCEFHNHTSDEFFNSLGARAGDPFDIIFIDGLHHFEQVLRDVRNALMNLSKNGVIILHDCNPQTERAQLTPRPMNPKQMIWNGDTWKAMVTLRSVADFSGLDCFTLDTDHGLGIVRRSRNVRRQQVEIDELSWENFVANRERWLGLIHPSKLEERLR